MRSARQTGQMGVVNALPTPVCMRIDNLRLSIAGYHLAIGPSERDSSARISLRPGAANLEGRMVNDTVGVLGRESVACIFQ